MVRCAQRRKGVVTRGSSIVDTREGSTSTVNDGSRSDTIAGAYQVCGPTGWPTPHTLVKLPPSRYSRHAIYVAAPHLSSSSSSPHIRPQSHAGAGPLGPKMGPVGPRSGPWVRHRPLRASTPSRCQEAAPTPHVPLATTAGPPGRCHTEEHRRRLLPREGETHARGLKFSPPLTPPYSGPGAVGGREEGGADEGRGSMPPPGEATLGYRAEDQMRVMRQGKNLEDKKASVRPPSITSLGLNVMGVSYVVSCMPTRHI